MELRISLADLCLSLRFRDAAGFGEAANYFAGFLSEGEPEGRVEVEWVELDYAHLPQDDQVSMPVGQLVHGQYKVSWEYYDGSYDTGTWTGTCRVRGLFGLHKFLWALMTVLLPERDGLVLHASSVSDGERAFIFPAPSGTGKSTLVRNSPDKILLADEGTLVRLIDGRLWAYGSPFRSDQFRDLEGRRVPVAGIYFLEQAPEDRMEPASPADALQRLLLETFLFVTDPGVRVQSFRVADSLLRSSSAHVLRLRNGPDFWRCLCHDVAR